MIEVTELILTRKNEKWSFSKREKKHSKTKLKKIVVSFKEARHEPRSFFVEITEKKDLDALEEELSEFFGNKVTVKRADRSSK